MPICDECCESGPIREELWTDSGGYICETCRRHHRVRLVLTEVYVPDLLSERRATEREVEGYCERLMDDVLLVYPKAEITVRKHWNLSGGSVRRAAFGDEGDRFLDFEDEVLERLAEIEEETYLTWLETIQL
jgi:hypothetical protein